jgi:hypothetical protein
VGDKTETAAAPAPIKQTLTLEVLSKNDAALLAREKQMAAGVEAEILTVKRAPAPDSEEERAAIWIQMQNVRQVRHGLASQPVSGMEPVFEHWLRLPNDFESDAIAGLKNLNTKDSRAALAELAKTPSKPNSSTQEGATRSLAEMGDRQYYPLMVQLLTSPDLNLRRAAIAGVGKLGGESGVAQLIEVLRTGSIVEQNDVLTALGNTNSRAAVKALIDLMGAKDAKGPVVAEWPLFVLTHHRLEQVTYRRTPAQTHEAWQQWWDAGGKNAPVHSPSECAQDAISHDAH